MAHFALKAQVNTVKHLLAVRDAAKADHICREYPIHHSLCSSSVVVASRA